MTHVVIGGQEESTSTAGRVVNSLARCGPHHVHDGLDERTRSEILSSPALYVRSVFLQQTFVGVTLYVHFQSHPLLFADQISDKAFQLGGVLNLVLRLSENHAQHSWLFAEFGEDMAIVAFQ